MSHIFYEAIYKEEAILYVTFYLLLLLVLEFLILTVLYSICSTPSYAGQGGQVFGIPRKYMDQVL